MSIPAVWETLMGTWKFHGRRGEEMFNWKTDNIKIG